MHRSNCEKVPDKPKWRNIPQHNWPVSLKFVRVVKDRVRFCYRLEVKGTMKCSVDSRP